MPNSLAGDGRATVQAPHQNAPVQSAREKVVIPVNGMTTGVAGLPAADTIGPISLIESSLARIS